MIVDVLGERKTEQVMRETWGHLAPNPRRTYHGTLIYAYGTYGDMVLLDADFGDLPDSPWFFDVMTEFAFDADLRSHIQGTSAEPGVYRFTGTYRVKQGFVGTIEEIPIGMRK